MALEKLAKTPALLRKIGQVGDTRPFYSPVDKAISEITQNKATGEQMLAALLKTKGVAKELKDRPAIKKALEQPKITKQELERVAAEHPPAQIEESRSSGTFNQLEPTLPNDGSLELVKDPPTFSGNKYPYGVRDTKTGDIIGYGWDKGDAILDVYSGYPQYWGKHAQYEQYTIPGGENYREILLKLPKGEGEVFKASHFEGEPNILAHARVSDRTGPNGEKILHVEEIQSDWHQAGRRKGYGTSEGVPDAPFKQNWHELVMKRLLDDAARNGYDKVAITPGTEQAKRYALSRHVNEIAVPMVNENGVRSVRIDPVDGTSIKLMVDQNGVVTGYGSGSNQFTGKSLDEVIGKDMADKVMNAAPDTKFSGGDLQIGGEGMKGFYDQILPSFLNTYGKPYGSQVSTFNLPNPKGSLSITDLQRERGLSESQWLDLTPDERMKLIDEHEAAAKQNVTPLHSFDITPQMREDIIGKGLPLYQVAPVGIGAGAAMQGEQPEGYGAGGVVKKATKAISALKGQQEILPLAEREANIAKFLEPSKVKERLYHATPKDLSKFNAGQKGSSGEAVWLTTNSEFQPAAHNISYRDEQGRMHPISGRNAKFREGTNVMPVHVQAKNPMMLDDPTMLEWAQSAYAGGSKEFPYLMPKGWADKVKEDYDSIVLADPFKRGDSHEVIMFNPEKIKSAIGNRGTYDITDPDINKANGGIIKKVAKMLMPQPEREANFAKFLADSKIQQRLYHGTMATEGDKGQEAIRRLKPSKEGALGSGAYMTPDPKFANFYAEQAGGNVLPLYVQMRNPLILRGSGVPDRYKDPMIEALELLGMESDKAAKLVDRAYENKGYIGKEVESRAKAAGYDGLLEYDHQGNLVEVVSYKPNAIKSAIGNRGTYDINEADITKAKGGRVTNDAMFMAVMNKKLKGKKNA